MAGLATVAVGVHGLAWWIFGERLLAGVEAFKTDAVRAGWTLEFGAPQRSGWPWAASVRLPRVVARRDLGGMIFEWRADQVAVTLSAMDPRAVQVSPSAQQRIAWGLGPPMPVQASAWLRVPLAATRPATFELRDVLAGGVRVGLVNGQIAALAFELTAAPVVLERALAPPFDQGFAITVAATLDRPLSDAATPRDAAAAWQAAGGVLSVPRMELQWGPVHMTASGSGGLDARLQPRGQATLHIEGGQEVLDAAERAGLVARGPASAVRAVLGLLTLASPAHAVSVPVTLEDGTLTAAQFPLLRLPQVDWSAPASLVAPRPGP